MGTIFNGIDLKVGVRVGLQVGVGVGLQVGVGVGLGLGVGLAEVISGAEVHYISPISPLYLPYISQRDVLIAICEAYATGDPDPSEEGGHMKVRWKQFAIDFDDFPMPLKARSP